MRVIRATAMGMCFGVRDALAAMRAEPRPVEVTVLGELVHNPAVTAELHARGFPSAPDASAAGTQAVMITAHGVSDRARAGLQAAGKRIIDTTCPLVRRAHAAGLALARDGRFVVVFGKRAHVEVRGLVGDLPGDEFAVVESAVEVADWGRKRIGVIAQTTAVERDFIGVVERIRVMNAGADVRPILTVCAPTRDRQAAVERLIARVDVLVVVGGRASNNTRQLVERGRAGGVRTLHVESAADLDPVQFSPEEIVGVTAGTSTLTETADAVVERLEGFWEECLPVARSVSAIASRSASGSVSRRAFSLPQAEDE